MGTKVNSNYEDLLTFTRASKGHALRPVSYGTELVTNGDFSDGTTGWSVYNTDATHTVTFSNGGARFQADTTSPILEIVSDVVLDSTKIYKLEVVISDVTSGSIKIDGQGVVQLYNSEGTHTSIITTTSNSGNNVIKFYRATADVDITIDSVSVKEVTFDESDGTLTLFEHPNNVPRVEYDADGNRLGLLVEEARTNLFTESERLSEKDHDMTTSDNAAIAPDRNQSASFCKPTTFATEHYIDDVGVIAGTDYAVSCFAKQGSGDYLLAFRGSGIGGDSPRFNLATGTIDNEGASSVWSNTKIEDVGNGWYRCSAIGNPNNTTPLRFQITESDGTVAFAGDGTSGLYIWGCQIELASFPTSYIKTTGSTTTRSADVASIPVADFGYNTEVGSVVAEYFPTKVDASVRSVFELSKDDDDRLYSSSSVNKHWFVKSGGTSQASIDLGTPTEDQSNKIAGVYKLNDFAASLDGGSVTTDTSGAVQTGITDLYIGSIKDSAAFHLNGHIKSIKYYPRRLTNAQLQALTEPRSTPTLSLTFDGLESSYTENYIHG